MKKRLLVVCLFMGTLCAAIAQNVGIGEPSPGSKLSVQGNSAIGADYSTTAAPTNGLLIEGITGVGTSTVDTNAILNVVSTSKGLLIPKLATVAMNAMVNPAKGMLIFNNDSADFYYYNGSAWVCNFAGSGAYIKNQTGQQSSSNYNISGNGTIGGTLTLAPMTTGSVLFAGASGVVSQDNSNIFWDDTHDRLGIGTASPSNSLSFTGQSAQTIWMERETTSNMGGKSLTIQAGGSTSGANKKNGGDLDLSSGTSTGTGTSNIVFYTFPGTAGNTTDNTQTEAMRINGSGYLGVNNNNPQYPVDVTGNVNSSTGFTVAGAAASGNYLRGNGTQFVASTIQASDLPSLASSYIQNQTSQQSSSNFNISGNGTIGGTLSLTPMTSGSLLFAGSSGTVTQSNSNLYWNNTNNELGIGANSFDGTNPQKLLVSAGTTSSVNAICGTGTINNYFQFNIQNSSSGASASSDLVATANNGSETRNYIDMGINGSGNTSANWGNADDAYLYTHGGNLNIGTDTAGKSLIFYTGGGASGNENMRINGSTGYVGIGATNPTSMLSVGSSSQFQVNSSGNVVKLNNVTTSFPSSQGAVNSVLTNDGSGNLTWTNNIYGGSLSASVTTINNTASYTAVTSDFLIFVTGTTATTVTVPNPAAGNTGRIIIVRNSTNQTVTVQTTSGSYMLPHGSQNTTAQATLAINKGGGGDAEGDMADVKIISTGSYWVTF